MIFISGGNMFLVNADQQKVDRGGGGEWDEWGRPNFHALIQDRGIET